MRQRPGYIVFAEQLMTSLLLHSEPQHNFRVYDAVGLKESDFGNEFVCIAVPFSHGDKLENISTWKLKVLRTDGESSSEGCTIFPSETEVIICKYDKLLNGTIYFTVDHKTNGEKKWEENTSYPLYMSSFEENSPKKWAKIRRLKWI